MYGEQVRSAMIQLFEEDYNLVKKAVGAGTDINGTSTDPTAGYYDGNIYLNTNTLQIFEFDGSYWNEVGRVRSIVDITGTDLAADGATNTITVTYNDGTSDEFYVKNGSKGSPGVSVTGLNDNGDGTFYLTLSNGTTTDPVATIKGDTGATGPAGPTGATGAPGRSITRFDTKDIGKTHTISAIYSDGTSEVVATVMDGSDGSGTGDMTKSTYDTNDDGVVDFAEGLTDGKRTLPFDSVWSKANAATTLGGYGIIDAYTKEDVDALLIKKIEDIKSNKIGGIGKIITSIEQANGVVSATEAALSDIVDGTSITVAGNKLRTQITPLRFGLLSDSLAPQWKAGSYPSGSYVMDNDQLYRNNSANATSGVPGVSSDWVETSVAEMLQTKTGTWTPTAREPIASFSNAMYSRTGNVVTCSARCVFGNITATNKMYFGGLPFEPAVNSQITGAYRCNSSDVGGALLGNIGSSDNRVWANDQCKAFANDTVYICFTYICK